VVYVILTQVDSADSHNAHGFKGEVKNHLGDYQERFNDRSIQFADGWHVI
jgi:hypothetical protein